MIKIISEDAALCRIIARELKIDKSKEGDCLKLLQLFLEHKDFEKTVDELATLAGSNKDMIMKVIANSCVPCEQSEEKA